MKLNVLLMMLAAGLLMSCAHTVPYKPATAVEKIEFGHDHVNIYPEDVRKYPDRYTNMTLVWAGLIVTNGSTEEDLGGKIRMETLLDHRYFDWEEERIDGNPMLLVSPRGEGFFSMRWDVEKTDSASSYADATKYAAPGKLAIVYATPVSVDEDGVISMRYHYIRILDRTKFSTDVITYGRTGKEPFRPVDSHRAKGPPSSASH